MVVRDTSSSVARNASTANVIGTIENQPLTAPANNPMATSNADSPGGPAADAASRPSPSCRWPRGSVASTRGSTGWVTPAMTPTMTTTTTTPVVSVT